MTIHLTNSTEQNPTSEANSHSNNQEMSLLFMKPLGSLPSSQEPVTGPSPDSDESSPQLPILLP